MKIYKTTCLVVTGVLVLLGISLFISIFPGFPFYGYAHAIQTESGEITITTLPFLKVIGDDFYSPWLRFGYLVFIAFQFASIPLGIIAFSMFAMNKARKGWIWTGVTEGSLAIESALALGLFQHTAVIGIPLAGATLAAIAILSLISFLVYRANGCYYSSGI